MRSGAFLPVLAGDVVAAEARLCERGALVGVVVPHDPVRLDAGEATLREFGLLADTARTCPGD